MKNFILLFLSEVHLTRYNKLQSVTYHSSVGDIQGIQSNEASVKFLLKKLEQQGEEIDRIFLFSTKRTKEKIDKSGIVTTRSHVEFFGEQLMQEYPQLTGRFTVIDYDEDMPIEEIILQVTGMAQQIKSYIEYSKNSDVRLHADMTGGFRHTTMMMLAVMQLLKYSGLKIGSVLYANYNSREPQKNRIDDVTDIHRIFGLVSGAEEFVNFGSVTAINEYFAERPELRSKELDGLLTAIRAFSDAVKICRTGEFEKCLENLSQQIAEFEVLGNKSLPERLFAEIIETIKTEYKTILTKPVKRLDIIEWCINKGFLQQAMTLYTEWIPTLIVDKKIYYPSAENYDEILRGCAGMDMGYKKWETVFVNDYIGESKNKEALAQPLSDKPWARFRKNIDLIKTGKVKIKFEKPFDGAAVQKLFKEINEADQHYKYLQKHSMSEKDMSREFPYSYKIIKDGYKRSGNCKYSLAEYIKRKMSTDFLLNLLGTATDDFFEKLLDIHLNKAMDKGYSKKRRVDNSPEGIAQKWHNREAVIKRMLADGSTKTDYPEIVNEVLQTLHWLRNQRNQRNQINHAADETYTVDNAEIMESIEKSLKTLKLIAG